MKQLPAMLFECKMKIFKYMIFITLLITGSFSTAAPLLTRNYSHRYFTTRDGLVQMQVRSIFQDRDGYIWFGTKGGVSRFDGISFKNITQEDGISVGDMLSISEWGYKKLFFFQNSFQIMHENDSLESIQLPDTLKFFKHSFQSIEIDEDEIILINIQNKLNELYIQNKLDHLIWNVHTRKFRKWNGIEYKILAFNDKYILTSNALYLRNGFSLTKIQSIPNNHSYAQVNWESGDFYLYNYENSAIEKYTLINNQFISLKTIISNVYNDRFTLLPDNSILYFVNNSEARIFPTQKASIGVEMAYLEEPFVDREGNLWITSNNGLYNFFNLNFEEYYLGLGKPDNIWSVLQDNEKNLWFGSYGFGLWRMDKTGKLLAANQSDPAWIRQYMGSTRSKSGTLYMPTSGGLTVYENGKFTNYLSGITLSSYFNEDKQQIYYSGFQQNSEIRGLWIGIDHNRKFIPWDKSYPVGLGKDSKGRIRLGSFRGQGYLLNDSIIVTDTVKRPYEGVISFATDKWGRLWKATTKGYYVEMLDGKEHRFAPQIKGLVASVFNYQDKYLLMGTGSGMAIALFKDDMLNNPAVFEIGYEGGFTGLETGQNAFFEDQNGDMWVCTATNVLKFNPDKLVQSQTRFLPPIRVSNISYSQNNYDWTTVFLLNQKEVKIASGNKFFRIDYIANSISAPKSLRFKYRLKGLSDKWSEPVYTKSVYYTNIGYGSYVFEVQCSLDGIHWSKVARSAQIEITVPFYYRPIAVVFYILLLIFISSLVTFSLYKRRQKIKIETITHQKLENELQLKTLRSKIIPHFTKNVLSAIGQFAMTDKIKAGHFISIFSRFTQLSLNNADKNFIRLEDELNYIEYYLDLEKMRFNERLNYKVDVDSDVDKSVLIPTMALHTFCDNAIRHGLVNSKDKGELRIKIFKTATGTTITVNDNGIGRKRASELGTKGNGQGLALIRAQIEFYNKINTNKITLDIFDLTDNTDRAVGTKIVFFIPNEYRFEVEK